MSDIDKRGERSPREGADDLWREFNNTARDGAQAPAAVVRIAEDCQELKRFVGEALEEKFGAMPDLDDDGDFVLSHMGQAVWVRSHPNSPAISISARVAHGVYSRRASEVEIGILNRRGYFVKWSLRERDIWQEIDMVAIPFVPNHLSNLIDVFFGAMSANRDDLAYRTGAKVG